MIDPELWSNLLGSGLHHVRATSRAAPDADEVLPEGLHPHDRAAAVAVLAVAAATPGFRTVLVGRLLHADRNAHARIEVATDPLNVVVAVTPDEPADAAPDPVTGLPGHSILVDRIDQGLLAAGRTGRTVGVIRVDLDGFGGARADHGEALADDVLRVVAAALERAVRPADTVTRLADDEFVVVIPELRCPADVAVVAERILTAVRAETDRALGTPVPASLGIGLGDATTGSAQLLVDAAAALARVKAAGGDRWMVAGMQATDDPTLRLDQLVRAALDDRTLDTWYQPVMGPDGRIARVEALVAVFDAHGDRQPAELILDAAARTGLQPRLDHRVVDRVAFQLAAWERAGLVLDASVNVATATATQIDLSAVVAAVLAREGLAPARLRIELAAADLGLPGVDRCVAALRQMGVVVAAHRWDGDPRVVDQAIELGVVEVKLDRAVLDLLLAGEPAGLREQVLRLHAARIGVTAVGVEHDGHRAAAARLGCTSIQGFGVSGPVPAAQLPATLGST